MYWYHDEEPPGMRIVWHNPAPPNRNRSRPRPLALDTDTTIYITGSPDIDAVFELISGGNLARVGERITEEECEQWG